MLTMCNDLIIIYLALINFVTFIVFAADKRKAIKQKRRIPERRLILLAAFGGSLGALFAMYLFHHKTRKPRFWLGIPLIFILQIIAGFYITKITAGF